VLGQTGQMLFLIVLLHFSLKTFPYIKLWPGFFFPNNAFEFDSLTISIFTPLSNLFALTYINNDTAPIDNIIVMRTPTNVITSGEFSLSDNKESHKSDSTPLIPHMP